MIRNVYNQSLIINGCRRGVYLTCMHDIRICRSERSYACVN